MNGHGSRSGSSLITCLGRILACLVDLALGDLALGLVIVSDGSPNDSRLSVKEPQMMGEVLKICYGKTTALKPIGKVAIGFTESIGR